MQKHILLIMVFPLIFFSCSSQGEEGVQNAMYNLTVQSDGIGGTIQAGLADEISGIYKQGEIIPLPPVRSDPGYTFDKWTSTNGGYFNSDDSNTYFTMPANDTTVIAIFKTF